MLGKIASPKQRPFQQEASLAPSFRNKLICDRLAAPDKLTASLDHPAEEVHVFPRCSKFRSKRDIHKAQDLLLEKNIAGAAFIPAQLGPSGVIRPIEESSLAHPCRSLVVKIRLHGPEDPIGSGSFQQPKKIQQPMFYWNLVI